MHYNKEIVHQYIIDFFGDNVDIVSSSLIGSSALSDQEKLNHDLEKHGEVRGDSERDIDILVRVRNLSPEQIDSWHFSDEAEELEMLYQYDVQLLSEGYSSLKKTDLILEFGKSDLQVIIGDAENFTIAYEIELEEILTNNDKFGFSGDMDFRYDQMYAALERGDFDEKDFQDIYDEYEDDQDQYSSYNQDFDDDSYGNSPDLNRDERNFPFTKNEIEQEFPQFFRDWGSQVDIYPDSTLDRGFEIVPKKYFSSIEESFNFVDSFFRDFYKQSRFELNNNTGWHINIGYKGKNLSNLNLLKGAVLLSDEFATKDFAQRLKGKYAKPIKDLLIQSVKDAYDYEVGGESLMMQVFSKNLDKIEMVGNEFLTSTGSTTKEFGFNPRNGYVEFRYPGGKLTPQQIKESTLYYCYIIKTIVDPEFKRKEYIKKLYKLLFGD